MPQDLPAWVAELTDPRRATNLDELADRLVPLAEHSIDVSRRLQALLNELNEPFKREALYGRVDRLKARSAEALEEISAEITASGRDRVERIRAVWAERVPDEEHAAELRARLESDILPALHRQERAAAEQVDDRTVAALEKATSTLLTRVEELAKAVTDLIHDVLPLAREGLTLASRISALSSQARKQGRRPSDRDTIPDDVRAEAAEVGRAFDEAVNRLELEWATLGSRSATVRSALRGAEETAFSAVTAEMTRCVEDLAPLHVKTLAEVEARAMALLEDFDLG